ncbi:MAG: hypothetical protein L3J74_14950 [Bacteroidales bacterium]|nr:hypothetical protein [Bacteroidales bacterium]
MKTIKLKLFRTIAIVLVIQLALGTVARSQVCKPYKKQAYGIASNFTNTSSGLGLLTETNLFYKCGKSEFKAGFVWQNQYQKISGLNLQYRYYLADNDYFNVFLYMNTMRNYNVNLRKEINAVVHRYNYSEIPELERFNTQEHYVGFGIQVRLVQNLFIDSKIGFGGYTSQILNEDYRNKNTTYHSDNDFALQLSVGLHYKVDIRKKSKRWP